MIRRNLVSVLIFATAVPVMELRAQALQNAPRDFTEQVRQAAQGQWTPVPTTLTPDALQGPPTPAAMFALVGMNDRQLARYLAAYRAHMAATWDTRWKLVSTLHLLDRAVQDSDSEAMLQYRLMAGRLWDQVRTLDEGFDTGLESILEAKQLRRYQEWKRAMQRETQVQQRLDAQSALADGSAAR